MITHGQGPKCPQKAALKKFGLQPIPGVRILKRYGLFGEREYWKRLHLPSTGNEQLPPQMCSCHDMLPLHQPRSSWSPQNCEPSLHGLKPPKLWAKHPWTKASKTVSQASMDWSFQNHEPRQIFPILKLTSWGIFLIGMQCRLIQSTWLEFRRDCMYHYWKKKVSTMGYRDLLCPAC